MPVPADVLTTAREAYARRAWTRAHELLARADAAAPLAADDLERLAVAAYMLGLDDEQLDTLARAHDAHLRDGDRPGAVRAAFWIGVHLIIRGEAGRATGWLGRAQRLLEHESGDCVERGYLASADALRSMVAGDWDATRAAAAAAVGVGERFGDPDLVALGLIDLGRALIEEGLVAEGLGRLDEAMVAAAAGELSPVATGLVYCGVIEGCHATYELARAREWTRRARRLVRAQPDLVPFTGTCLLHRAEILQIRGAWDEALLEARLACSALHAATGPAGGGRGVLPLRRDPAGAGRPGRRRARVQGRQPPRPGAPAGPGAAPTRAGPDRRGARRDRPGSLDAASGWVERARLLPAYVEILLAAGELDGARRRHARSSTRSRGRHGRTMLLASAAQARGMSSSPPATRAPRRPAPPCVPGSGSRSSAPYEAARARLLVAEACRTMGDDETAEMELEAARDELARLGAGCLARADRPPCRRRNRPDAPGAPGAAQARDGGEQQGDRRSARREPRAPWTGT